MVARSLVGFPLGGALITRLKKVIKHARRGRRGGAGAYQTKVTIDVPRERE